MSRSVLYTLGEEPSDNCRAASRRGGVCAEAVDAQRRDEVLGILDDGSAVELPEGIEAELQQLEEVISTSRAAEDTVCRYAEWLVSTTNNRTSAEREAHLSTSGSSRRGGGGASRQP